MKSNKNYEKSLINSRLIPILIGLILISVGISGCIEEPEKPIYSYFYSFENDMENWINDGTDLGNPTINWTIERSQEHSYEGNYSVKLYLENYNDAGKIWIEKEFNYSPNTEYEVTVSYLFATRDFGEVNLFRIITGVATESPETSDDLTYQDDTGHHQDEDIEFIWLEKNYTFSILTSDTGKIFVSIGVWGTWETPRTYYIDSVNITFSKVTKDEIPQIEGNWIVNYYDWTGNLTKTENFTITRNDFEVKFFSNNTEICSGTILVNNLPFPYNTTDFLISGCDFGGLGISKIFIHDVSYMKTELPLCENCNPAILSRR